MWNIYIRPFLEAVYFIASIGLVFGIWIGIKQLRLMQEDTKAKYKRASVEKSIEYLNWFATDQIPKFTTFTGKVRESGIKVYIGEINPDFRFDKNCDISEEYVTEYLRRTVEWDALNLLNQLEYFSAALISGLADEELMFNPIARTYCHIIETNYLDICYYRKDETSTFYSNIVELYSVWKPRLVKLELVNKRSKIDDDISKISEQRIHSIGG